jgi:HAD superfamily hydrolase (TIGR01549 family)
LAGILITNLIFDLDDTLVHSTRAYAEVLQAMGVNPEAYAGARREVKQILGSENPSARNRLLYFKAMLEQQNRFSPERLLKMINEYETRLETHLRTQWQALNRAPLFEELSQRFKLSVITNENTRTQMIKMRAIDPEKRYFSFILTSEEAGVEKPNPQIFQNLFSRLRVTPQNVLLIGDDYRCDMKPAIQLGCKAVWSQEFSKPADQDSVIPEKMNVTSNLNETLLELL